MAVTGAATGLMQAAGPAQLQDSEFLPDFCRGRLVLNVVVLAEFLAITATLLVGRLTNDIFQDLFLISLFVQWIALVSLAVLCALRRPLNRLPAARALVMAHLLLVCITFVVGEAGLWLLYAIDGIDSPRPSWYAEFHVRNLTVAAIIAALVLRYLLARHQLRQRTLSEAAARMETRRYRLRRHFLFNCLNIIASLTSHAPARAETAIEDMADLFRLMVDESKDLVLVSNEIAIARKFLRLERLRLDNRLQVEWETQAIPRNARIPVLMLQVLLEDAIRYGIEPFTEGGIIGIKIGCQGETLHVHVDNPVSTAVIDGAAQGDSPTYENVRVRLYDHFEDRARIDLSEKEGRFSVDITHHAFGGIE